MNKMHIVSAVIGIALVVGYKYYVTKKALDSTKGTRNTPKKAL